MVEGRSAIKDSRDDLYQKANLLVEGFEQKFSHINCQNLIQLQLGTEEASNAYRTRGLKTQCEGYIRETASRTVELLSLPD